MSKNVDVGPDDVWNLHGKIDWGGGFKHMGASSYLPNKKPEFGTVPHSGLSAVCIYVFLLESNVVFIN